MLPQPYVTADSSALFLLKNAATIETSFSFLFVISWDFPYIARLFSISA
jgi:hypothetical protein